MMQPIIEHLTYPLWQWYNGYSDLSILRQLLHWETLPAEAIKTLQQERLKTLLLHAYQTVPFYRKRFDACGFSPDHFSDLSEFQRVPTLSKAEVNAHLDAMISSASPKHGLIPNSTGGSTGMPVKFFQSHEKRSYIRAVTFRGNMWLGCRLGDKMARLWGSRKDLRGAASFKFWAGNTFVRRTVVLDTFRIDEKKIRRLLVHIKAHQPKLIIAYAGAAYLIAKYAERHSIQPYSPQFLVTTAETLYDDQKALIERVFLTKVVNRYASREIGQIASGCGQAPGLHINEDCVFLEILPLPKQTGGVAMGKIVVTDLTNLAMPMIRYDTGDIGVLETAPCRCTLPFSKLKTVEGRISDLFLTPDGTYVHSMYFWRLLDGMRGIKQVQIIQETLDLIRVNIVKETEIPAHDIAKIVSGIQEKMGHAVRVDVAFPTALEQGMSGKHRFTISKVTSPAEHWAEASRASI